MELSGLFFYKYLIDIESAVSDDIDQIIVSGLIGATDGLPSMASAGRLTNAIKADVESQGYTPSQVAIGHIVDIKRV
jgi:hypothetical protein